MRADLALMQVHRMAGAVHLLSLMEANAAMISNKEKVEE